ncbi:hypothetical protein BJ508DRAFT_48274 [Ascobolus immersus RN42]|uniref:Uncharacterized protein n=1 Tax=Ascobolus immersus RN42 TaxID=1160509 RepID=A0A3N4HM72_ASCIM|nr:hypothetical protein BJ508DRAFT_48274 [Ascobolus immersus RN42]
MLPTKSQSIFRLCLLALLLPIPLSVSAYPSPPVETNTTGEHGIITTLGNSTEVTTLVEGTLIRAELEKVCSHYRSHREKPGSVDEVVKEDFRLEAACYPETIAWSNSLAWYFRKKKKTMKYLIVNLWSLVVAIGLPSLVAVSLLACLVAGWHRRRGKATDRVLMQIKEMPYSDNSHNSEPKAGPNTDQKSHQASSRFA